MLPRTWGLCHRSGRYVQARTPRYPAEAEYAVRPGWQMAQVQEAARQMLRHAGRKRARVLRKGDE